MTGLQKIIEQINDDASQRAQEIENEAHKKAEVILAEAKEKEIKEVTQIEEKSKWTCSDILARGKSSAELQKKKAKLDAKQKIISEVINKALDRLYSLNNDNYFEMIYKMIKKNSLPQDGEIAFNQKDLSILPADFEQKLNSCSNGTLTVSKQPRNIKGGFILIYGGIEENCSFEALFASANEQLQDDVHNFLFS